MKEITCSRGVEWGDVCLARFSYNYNIYATKFIYETESRSIYLRGSERRMLKTGTLEREAIRDSSSFSPFSFFLDPLRSFLDYPLPFFPSSTAVKIICAFRSTRLKIEIRYGASLLRDNSSFTGRKVGSFRARYQVSSAVHNRDWLRRLRYNHCHLSSSAMQIQLSLLLAATRQPKWVTFISTCSILLNVRSRAIVFYRSFIFNKTWYKYSFIIPSWCSLSTPRASSSSPQKCARRKISSVASFTPRPNCFEGVYWKKKKKSMKREYR